MSDAFTVAVRIHPADHTLEGPRVNMFMPILEPGSFGGITSILERYGVYVEGEEGKPGVALFGFTGQFRVASGAVWFDVTAAHVVSDAT